MLYFITSNQHKLEIARYVLYKFDIQFSPSDLKIDEIQSDSIEKIARHKAREAFRKLQQPLFVKDDGWFITALNGFPGAFMHYINQWLSPNDILKLMADKTNRETVLHEVICYIDQDHFQTFTGEVKGHILYEARGQGLPNNQIVTMRADGKSIAECRQAGEPFFDKETVWTDFVTWYREKIRD